MSTIAKPNPQFPGRRLGVFRDKAGEVEVATTSGQTTNR